jgi:hypothetical protein
MLQRVSVKNIILGGPEGASITSSFTRSIAVFIVYNDERANFAHNNPSQKA